MFRPDTTKEDIDKKLYQVTTAYQLPDVLSDKNAIFPSQCSVDHYQNSIFPLNSGFGESALSGSALTSGSSSSLNSTNIIIGQGIHNNQGIQLSSLSKIPAYSMNIKDEPETTPITIEKDITHATPAAATPSATPSATPATTNDVTTTGISDKTPSTSSLKPASTETEAYPSLKNEVDDTPMTDATPLISETSSVDITDNSKIKETGLGAGKTTPTAHKPLSAGNDISAATTTTASITINESDYIPPPAYAHKGKNILNGLILTDSISSLSGSSGVGVSNLNAQLIRLPLLNSNYENVDSKNRNINVK
ncbi:unnamed protein product [[Candida] boidinii]|uniref:Unnamed protein product n=1 Tax=Candida boidinii TaxID=5477 RepID=A0ACB5TJN2_CANBO|nr:unnamed protein product [[Candida] boidinii]